MFQSSLLKWAKMESRASTREMEHVTLQLQKSNLGYLHIQMPDDALPPYQLCSALHTNSPNPAAWLNEKLTITKIESISEQGRRLNNKHLQHQLH